MKRIIIHWTAGFGSPNFVDKKHYHYLIDSSGGVHNGDFKPEDNENCNDGKYAAHTGGGILVLLVLLCVVCMGLFLPTK